MSSRSAADQEFQRISVEIQPPGTIANAPTCTRLQPTATPTSSTSASAASGSLTVNITLPANNGLLQANSDAVNVAITLPPSVLPPDGPTMNLDVEAPVGNIAISGISEHELSQLASGKEIRLFEEVDHNKSKPTQFILLREENAEAELHANT